MTRGELAENRSVPGNVRAVLGGVGTLALLAFWIKLLRIPWDPFFKGWDFNHLFLAGYAWRHQILPYQAVKPAFQVPDGPFSYLLEWYYYPPFCSLLIAPLSYFHYPTVAFLWRVVSVALLLWSFWEFLRIVAPDQPASLRIFVLGIVSLTTSMHQVVHAFQPTMLVVAALTLFARAVIRSQWRAAVLLAVLISIKPSFLLPVAGMFLFRRRWDLLVVSVALIIALNIVAALPTGVGPTLGAYFRQMTQFNQPGSPHDPRAEVSLNRQLNARPEDIAQGQTGGQFLQAEFLFSSWIPNLALARALGTAFKLASLGFLAWLWVRVRRTDLPDDPHFLAILFGVWMNLSLLFVFHQRYDAVAILPSLFVALAWIGRNPRSVVAWMAFVSGVIPACLLPTWLVRLYSRHVVAATGWVALFPIYAYLTLIALLASAALLWQYVSELQKYRLKPPMNADERR